MWEVLEFGCGCGGEGGVEGGGGLGVSCRDCHLCGIGAGVFVPTAEKSRLSSVIVTFSSSTFRTVTVAAARVGLGQRGVSNTH